MSKNKDKDKDKAIIKMINQNILFDIKQMYCDYILMESRSLDSICGAQYLHRKLQGMAENLWKAQVLGDR